MQRLHQIRIQTLSCWSIAMGGHYTCAPSVRRRCGHLIQGYETQRGCIGDWGSPTHQLAHATSPTVPNTASRRALSHRFSLRCSVHACTSSSCVSATGHAYAYTIEAICGVSSARKQRSGRARMDDGCANTAHVQVPAPIAPRTAPTTCNVRSSSTCAPSYRMAVVSPRQGQDDHGRVSTGPKHTQALRCE